MEWMIFILVCWVAVRFLGVATGRGRGERWEERRLRRAERWEERRLGRAERRGVTPPPVRVAPPKPVETPEEKLRRQYVEGTLSVEQYERELDRLYRPDA